MTSPTADPAEVAAARLRLKAAGVEVLFEDHLLLGISKAAGVLSQGGPAGETSLVDLVDAYRREAERKAGHAFVGLVHRLDRNVSGVMVVAKSSKAASRLSAAFRSRSGLEKTYLAWVAGHPDRDRATLTGALVRDTARRVSRVVADGDEEGPDDATSVSLEYEVDGRGPSASRLRVRLHTGATHQIRAQLAGAGLPLYGDAKYEGPSAPAAARCARPALHAFSLTVPHPISAAPVSFQAPVPPDLLSLDRALRIDPPLA